MITESKLIIQQMREKMQSTLKTFITHSRCRECLIKVFFLFENNCLIVVGQYMMFKILGFGEGDFLNVLFYFFAFLRRF
ncbi:hypothetical protein [uncultured Gammaproteobacteria bacterium]|nr:hypothetical protein [uncultured Gammaproteobacteria bacterium]